MIRLLVRLFIKDSNRTEDPAVRGAFGVLAGGVGIFLNLCLFGAKFAAGMLTASIAIMADAFNNLSDAGSSVVTLVGLKMAGMPADSEHPFGHGRIEYLTGLAISMAILLVGFELLRSSFGKILRPEEVLFRPLSFAILGVSILVKVWMCYFNRTLGNMINSTAMKATSADSLTDAVATAAVALGVLFTRFTGINIDGWTGMLVAAFILYSGFTTARDSLSPLLGQAPDTALVREIEDTVRSHPEVIGVHDLIIHDYGPGRRIVSLHAEVPCNMDILAMHDAIDLIELELRHKFNCDVTIHMDPVATDDKITAVVRGQVEEMVKRIDPALSIHDFRMVQGMTHTNLIFDVSVPHRFHLSDKQVADRVRDGVQLISEKYYAVIRVEQSFV